MNSKFRIQSSELKKGISFIFSLSFLVLFVACSDFGDRDNPLDPAADNYVVLEESSSSVKSSSSVYIYSAGKNSSSSNKKAGSSSSTKGSSSSTKGSSSSVKNNAPETLSYGELEDSRDGKTYKTIVIGSQNWMAENLNYKVNNSYCYDDDDSYCDKYGRLYTLTSAENLCPEGWRLPTRDDFEDLLDYVGSVNNLKAEKGSGSYYEETNNVYGFTAYAIGGRYDCGDDGIFYYNGGWCSQFWTSTKAEFGMTYAMLICGNDGLDWAEEYVTNAFSIRCIEGTLPSSSSAKGSSSSEESASEESSSSSGTKKSSSSVFSIEEYLNPNISYGEITDDRDGQVYKTVKIGERVWMAQNLNFETDGSYCYEDKPENCVKLGRLYTWGAAMDSAGAYSDEGKNCGNKQRCTPLFWKHVRGICPDGWHIPSRAEVYSLTGEVNIDDDYMLRSKVWVGGGSQATNETGFSLVQTGERDSQGKYNMSVNGYIWNAFELSAYSAIGSFTDGGGFAHHDISKRSALSVRCVMDYVTTGTLTDDRDGQTYKTVKIGDQNWMAENLNFAYNNPDNTKDSTSFCYDNSPDNCAKYGRLYYWSAAMDSLGLYSKKSEGCGNIVECIPEEPVRGVCPKGWLMPTKEDFDRFILLIGGSQNGDVKQIKSTTGWKTGGNGSDSYGFTAFPVGVKGFVDEEGDFQGMGNLSIFWTSTEMDYRNAYEIYIGGNMETVGENSYWLSTGTWGKGDALSVRCIEDAK